MVDGNRHGTIHLLCRVGRHTGRHLDERPAVRLHVGWSHHHDAGRVRSGRGTGNGDAARREPSPRVDVGHWHVVELGLPAVLVARLVRRLRYAAGVADEGVHRARFESGALCTADHLFAHQHLHALRQPVSWWRSPNPRLGSNRSSRSSLSRALSERARPDRIRNRTDRYRQRRHVDYRLAAATLGGRGRTRLSAQVNP